MPKNAQTITQLHSSHTLVSKLMLKILQPRIQQYMNQELVDIQAEFRGDRNQRSNCQYLLAHRKSKRIPEKHLLCFIGYAQDFDYVDHSKLWKIPQEMGIPDHFTCLLKNLYAGQEATVRTRRVTLDWFKIGKGAHQCCILSPCLFNLYAEYIMRNTGLDKSQAGIKIAGENINNLR